MDIYMPTNERELSQKKLEEYDKYCKLIQAGRKNPIWFSEFIFGIKLFDFQKWVFMNSWTKPYCLWLCSRGAGKTTLASVLLMTKMLLIPDYKIYISTNSAAQSQEVYGKLESIALRKIPSFDTLTDIFADEVYKGANSETGFMHNPAAYKLTLLNNSSLETLSTNLNAIRGKRGSVLYDECAWQTSEQMAATEHFADVNADVKLGTSKIKIQHPPQVPLQLLYASSAGDVTFPYFSKYQEFSRKMFIGDPNYFVCDLNANTIVDYSTVDGEKVQSHLTQEAISKAIDEDPELADRELFNKFRKGAGQNAVVKAETLVRNSTVRVPLLCNDTGKKKFILCYDPARNFDGSMLGVFQVIDDSDVGFRLQIENMIAMVDHETKAKTPLPMPQQLEIIKKTLIAYNGDRAADWENILGFYIDAGSGGGGISAVADQLMEDWVDDLGKTHRGIIDPEHKQYETARSKYPNAVSIVRLIDPQGYKKIMYGELEKNMKLDLINFTSYDNKDYLSLETKDGEFENYILNFNERMALLQVELTKNEMVYMCRYDTPNGGVQYELAKDRKNKMHDDRSYVCSLAAYALSLMRRKDLLKKPHENMSLDKIFVMKKPQLIRGRW